MGKKIVIIGGGFGGLSAAIRLLSKGYDVTIFEKLDKPGGKAYVFEKDGCKFDAGPTIITAPFLFEELFSLSDRNIVDYVPLKELDPFYKIFDDTGKSFEYRKDIDALEEQISNLNYDDIEGYRKFIEHTKPIFEKYFVELGEKPFLKYSDMLKIIPGFLWLKSYKSVYNYISTYIENEFLRKCLSFQPLLAGGNPCNDSSIYTMVHYLERRWGVHYVEGGTGALVKALEKLIIELGGKIEYNTEVKEILTEGRKVTGVRINSRKFVEADHIIANSDTAYTYINMINPNALQKYHASVIDKMKHSMSLFVVYFSTSKDYSDSQFSQHNIVLAEKYSEMIKEILPGEKLSEDFPLYVYMPTKHDHTVAPAGESLFYAFSPAPNLKTNINWNKISDIYSEKIIDFLDHNYLPDLKRNIKIKFYTNPLYFRNTYNCYLGSVFSFQPVLSQLGYYRPHNRSEEFDNLYLVGAGTHPGAGLSGVLLSAKIAEKLILERS
jgi:phytoene desaturase